MGKRGVTSLFYLGVKMRKLRPVIEIDKFGTLITLYYDINEVAKKLNIGINAVEKIINEGKVIDHHIFMFYYEEDYNALPDNFPIKQINSNGEIVNQFHTIVEAANAVKIHRNTISKIINTGIPDYYGCIWIKEKIEGLKKFNK